MQIKVAIFYEGESEYLFLEKLIEEYFSIKYKGYEVSFDKIVDEKAYKSYQVEVQDKQIKFVLIYGHSDQGVSNKVTDEAESLIIKKGYNKVLGLRDLYCCDCRTLAQKHLIIDKIEKQNQYIQNKLTRKNLSNRLCSILLSIMEIEAWFICDYQLFQKIDSRLTPDYINEKLKIEIDKNDPETAYDHPSELINNIFNLIGRNYKKKKWADLEPIIKNIDFAYLLIQASEQNKIERFKNLLAELDSCVEQI